MLAGTGRGGAPNILGGVAADTGGVIAVAGDAVADDKMDKEMLDEGGRYVAGRGYGE